MVKADVIGAYEAFLKNQKGASANTLASYMRDIRQFSSYLDETGIDILSVTKGDLDSYSAHLKELGKSAATVCRTAATLRSFYSYAASEKLIGKDPTAGFEVEKAVKKLPSILTGKEVELPIARLAQLARAVGIHLIIATQRPTTNIITGTIKANFPARVAFRVTSGIDSKTILDTGGAQQLIGRGDMLISLAGKDMVRLQCALIDTPEIEKLVRFIGDQRGYPEGFELPEYLDENEEPNKEFDAKSKDEFFNDAARLVVSSQFGSTSLLQRKLQLGYNRAGRIIDQLEAAGIVGPSNGSKPRDVLIHDEVSLEELLKSL